MRACFTSQVHYDQGLFGLVSGVSGTIHSISGSTGYIGEVYVTGSDGEWCQVHCTTPFSCTDLSGCHLIYDTGHQVVSGDLVVTGYISGSSLHIGDCALTVTTGGRLGINTCEPLCDIDIRGDICHNSGNYINNSGYISGSTGYIGEVYVTGSDGEWCQVHCTDPFITASVSLPTGICQAYYTYTGFQSGSSYISPPQVLVTMRMETSSNFIYGYSTYNVDRYGFGVSFTDTITETGHFLDILIDSD